MTFTARLRRTSLPLAAGLLLALLVAAPNASARVIEYGAVNREAVPSCPGTSCLVTTKTTAFQTRASGKNFPLRVRRAGRLVAVTVRLGEPTDEQEKYFNDTYGGTARMQLAVVNKNEPGRALEWKVRGVSEVFRVTPWFGRTQMFPLDEPIPVRRGDDIALTIPTWMPILAVSLPEGDQWRASRPADRCGDGSLGDQTALTEVGVDSPFQCLYSQGRLTFSATMLTEPTPPKRQPSDPKPRPRGRGSVAQAPPAGTGGASAP